MAKWLKQKSIDKDNPTFKEALINWIIYDYQAFIVTKGNWFKRMIKAASYHDFIP
jgi:hypothetical protein